MISLQPGYSQMVIKGDSLIDVQINFGTNIILSFE